MNNHLTPQQMLSYIDGELSKSDARTAEEHLHSCWTCLTEVEKLKADIATILEAQREQFEPALPPPPKPWASIEALMARTQPEEPASSLWARLAVYLNATLTPARLVILSCLVAVFAISMYSIFHVKTVSAKEILRRIQVVDTQRSAITASQVIRERVHIRKTIHGHNQPQTMSVDTWKSRHGIYWNVAISSSPAADLEAQYKAHDIPVDLPLSSASVDSWRKAAGGDATVSHKGADMDVSFAGSGSGAAGTVEVSLLVQPESWQVKRMTLDFADESYEVTEDDYAVVPTSDVPADLLAYLEPSPLPQVAAAQPSIQPLTAAAAASVHLPMVNLDAAELNVLTKLHDLKADLGEPVTVTRSNQAIQVGVWQLPPERQNEIRTALADQPGVLVELTEPRAPLGNRTIARTAAPSAGDTPLHVDVESGGDDQRLLKFFGTEDREQDFTNEALATSTAILSHLYALKNLQEQFPIDKMHSLAPEEQSRLDMLVRDHATAIAANLNSLSRQFAPVDANFKIPPCVSSVSPVATNWQSESLGALETARVIDHLLRALLTTSQAPAIPDSALPQIDQNLCRLRAEMKNLASE